jgi:hypothetical protein
MVVGFPAGQTWIESHGSGGDAAERADESAGEFVVNGHEPRGAGDSARGVLHRHDGADGVDGGGLDVALDNLAGRVGAIGRLDGGGAGGIEVVTDFAQLTRVCDVGQLQPGDRFAVLGDGPIAVDLHRRAGLDADGASGVIQNVVALGDGDQFAPAVERHAAVAGEPDLVARAGAADGHDQKPLAADGDIERVAGAIERALSVAGAGGRQQHAGAEALEQPVGGKIEQSIFDAGGLAGQGKGGVGLEAHGLDVGEVVGRDILPVHRSDDARRGEVVAVVHVRTSSTSRAACERASGGLLGATSDHLFR